MSRRRPLIASDAPLLPARRGRLPGGRCFDPRKFSHGRPATQDPVFQIQRVYLKDLSLEQPNSPAILLEQEQPTVDIQLGVDAQPVTDGIFEITVSATVQTKIQDRTVFLVEAKQAGIFEIRNLPEDQMGPILGIACPQIVYPYLRGNVADVIQRGGFPPVHLAEINFQAMFEAAGRRQAAAAPAPRRSSRSKRRDATARQRPPMKICVLGAGAWGTALAVNAAGRHRSRCGRATRRRPRPCRRRARTRATCPASRCLRRCRIGADFAAALATAPISSIVATPMAGLREQLAAACAMRRRPVAWLCKGVEPALTSRRWPRPRNPGAQSRRAGCAPAC